MHNRRLAALQRPDGQASSRHGGRKPGMKLKTSQVGHLFQTILQTIARGYQLFRRQTRWRAYWKAIDRFFPARRAPNRKNWKRRE